MFFKGPMISFQLAMGLSFSVNVGIEIPRSLQNIYKELSTDIPGFQTPDHGNLIPWARQGVLLLNSVYTTGQVPNGLMLGSVILGFIVALVTIFKPTAAPITAPIYAVLEGGALGSLSGIFEIQYPGIVSTAVMSTFVVVMTMLALWKFKIIVPTQRFRSIITGAIGGICVLYIANMIFSLFGANLIPQTGPISIIVSLVVCTVAAFSLVLDFENIQVSVDEGLPKYFEYYNAFSLLVTICWLYVEILKLLSKRDN